MYLGDTGEINATLRPANAAQNLTHSNGGGAHYLATGASTGGQFGLYRWDMGPLPSGPAPHFHRAMSESFFVLSGTIRMYDGTQWLDGTAGDFLHVPEGGIHGFRNDSGVPASMLLLFVPGVHREEYFETLADAARREAMSEQDKVEFYVRHDTYWT